MTLSERDLKQFSQEVHNLYSATDPDRLRHAMTQVVSRLVPCDCSAYNEIDQTAGRIFVIHNHGAEADRLFPALLRHADSHPVLQHWKETGDQSTHKVSDFLTLRQWRERAVCQEFFGRLGLPYQMAFALEVDQTHHISVTLQRNAMDFKERDRTLLNLLRPHFAQAFANAQVFARVSTALRSVGSGLEASNKGMICLSESGEVVWISPGAERCLSTYLGQSFTRALEELKPWINACQQLSGTDLSSFDRTFPGPQGTLRIRVVRGDGFFLLLREESATCLSRLLKTRGVTAREQEVLRWLGEGKSDLEIARILAISHRTVHKHVEHILRKLNFETRRDALIWFRDLVD